MRPRFFNSLKRKIDLYFEFVESLLIAFLQNEERFCKKLHSEKLHKFQPSPDL